MLHAYVPKNAQYDKNVYKIYDLGAGKYCLLLKDEDTSFGEIKLRKRNHPDTWHMTELEAEWWGTNVVIPTLGKLEGEMTSGR